MKKKKFYNNVKGDHLRTKDLYNDGEDDDADDDDNDDSNGGDGSENDAITDNCDVN